MPMLDRAFYLSAALVLGVAVFAAPGSIALDSSSQQKAALLPIDRLIRVPLARQATDYTCGVAALQSVLGYYGDEFREDLLSKALKANPKVGTSYREMARFARAKGYVVEIKTGLSLAGLKQLLDQRRPVICLIQAWPDKRVDFANDWSDGHYVVAVGYDEKNIYFMDPSTLGHYTYIPVQEFLNRWHDTDSDEKLVHFGMVLGKEKTKYNPTSIKPLH